MSTRIAVLPQVGHGVRIGVRGVRLLFGEVGWWLGGGLPAAAEGSTPCGDLVDRGRVRGLGGGVVAAGRPGGPGRAARSVGPDAGRPRSGKGSRIRRGAGASVVGSAGPGPS